MTTPSETAKFKILKSLKFYMKLMGIFEVELSLRKHKIPISFFQRIFILSTSTVCTLTSFWYCLFEANSNYELFESLYMSIALFFITILYSILLWKRDQIDKSINLIEEMIENRKFNNLNVRNNVGVIRK